MGPFLHFNHDKAGVVKLVDAEDSKSSDPCGRVGSIPTSGTKKNHTFLAPSKSMVQVNVGTLRSFLGNL